MKNLLIFNFFLFFVPSLFAQKEIVLDLSKNANVERTISAGTYDIKLINIIPALAENGEYKISIIKEYRLDDPLEYSNTIKNYDDLNTIKANLPEFIANGCIFEEEINELEKVQDESSIPNIIKELQSKIEDYNESVPSKECEALLGLSNRLIQATKWIISEDITINKNEKLTIKIENLASDKEWNFNYNTEKNGNWLTTYGFSFIYNWFGENDKYFSKENDNGDYTITKLNERSNLDFSPSIMFTYFPYKYINTRFAPTFTGGLGFDMEAPTVFAGFSLIYRQNITLTLGLVAHQKQFLAGQYESGSIISDNLTENQLHINKYGLDPFFSLSFRLNQNPFSKKEEDAADGE